MPTTEPTKPKKKPGRPPGQRYKGWKVVVRQLDNPPPFDEEAFLRAIELLAEHSPQPVIEPEVDENAEEPELAIWAS